MSFRLAGVNEMRGFLGGEHAAGFFCGRFFSCERMINQKPKSGVAVGFASLSGPNPLFMGIFTASLSWRAAGVAVQSGALGEASGFWALFSKIIPPMGESGDFWDFAAFCRSFPLWGKTYFWGFWGFLGRFSVNYPEFQPKLKPGELDAMWLRRCGCGARTTLLPLSALSRLSLGSPAKKVGVRAECHAARGYPSSPRRAISRDIWGHGIICGFSRAICRRLLGGFSAASRRPV